MKLLLGSFCISSVKRTRLLLTKFSLQPPTAANDLGYDYSLLHLAYNNVQNVPTISRWEALNVDQSDTEFQHATTRQLRYAARGAGGAPPPLPLPTTKNAVHALSRFFLILVDEIEVEVVICFFITFPHLGL